MVRGRREKGYQGSALPTLTRMRSLPIHSGQEATIIVVGRRTHSGHSSLSWRPAIPSQGHNSSSRSLRFTKHAIELIKTSGELPARGAQPAHHDLLLPAQLLDRPPGEAPACRTGCCICRQYRFPRGFAEVFNPIFSEMNFAFPNLL